MRKSTENEFFILNSRQKLRKKTVNGIMCYLILQLMFVWKLDYENVFFSLLSSLCATSFLVKCSLKREFRSFILVSCENMKRKIAPKRKLQINLQQDRKCSFPSALSSFCLAMFLSLNILWDVFLLFVYRKPSIFTFGR